MTHGFLQGAVNLCHFLPASLLSMISRVPRSERSPAPKSGNIVGPLPRPVPCADSEKASKRYLTTSTEGKRVREADESETMVVFPSTLRTHCRTSWCLR